MLLQTLSLIRDWVKRFVRETRKKLIKEVDNSIKNAHK